MTLNAILDAMHSPKALIALYEPRIDLLRTVVVPMMEEWLERFKIKATYNKAEKIITTDSKTCGNFILRSYEEPHTIVGYQVYRSHVDELDILPEQKTREAWFKIIARNRQKPEGVAEEYLKDKIPFNKVCAYSTPEGYKFCYKMWKLSKNPEFQAVHGYTAENPTPGIEAFIDSLRAIYPERVAQAYLEGQFVNMESGSVYYAYDRKKHSSKETIKSGEPLYIGCDFNVTNQAATIWVKREGGQQWHAVAELSGVYDTPEMIRIIKERWQAKGHIIYMYPDASGSARHTTNASISDIAMLRGAGFIVRAHSKNPRVADRVAATNKAFADGRLFINDTLCNTGANCLEQQAYDKNGEPDKKSGFDHQNDATSYPIAYEMSIRRPLFSVPISWTA